MAKLGKEQYKFGGFGASFALDIEVFFTKKEGFYCKVPENILQYAPKPTIISGASYEEAVKNTKAYCENFYRASIQQKKVILYAFNFKVPSKYIPSIREKHPNAEGITRNGSLFSDYIAINEKVQFQFYVKWLITIGNHKYINDNKISTPSEMRNCSRYKWSPSGGYSPNDWSEFEITDHSEYLEEWFKNTYEKLGLLIGTISEFFGNEAAALLENIAKSKPLSIEANISTQKLTNDE